MADTITFTPGGTSGVALTVTPIRATFKAGGAEAEDKGGGNYSQARAAQGASGSCEVELDSVTCTLALLKALIDDCCTDEDGAANRVGFGDTVVLGDGAYDDLGEGPVNSETQANKHYGCVLDLEIKPQGAMVATITWKGSLIDDPA